MNAKRVQAASIILSGLLILIALSDIPFLRSKSVEISCFILGYISVLIAVASTIFRYRNEHRAFLPDWRRILYALSLTLMVALSLSPLVTWPLVLSGKYPATARYDPIFLILFGANVSAMVLIWFGRGWSRIGLAALNLLLLLLWAFPMATGF